MINRNLTYICLAIKYPNLKGFLQASYEMQDDEGVMDFLFDIETTDVVVYQ